MTDRMRLPEPITSRQNARVVELAKLAEKKHRKAVGKFRFDGLKLAREAISHALPLRAIFLMQSRAQMLCETLDLQTIGVEIVVLEDGLFSRISEEDAPEGIICVCDFLSIHSAWTEDSVSSSTGAVVLLESVRDPSNLGAIVRSAAAFGIDTLLLSEDCADIYNAKTVRASMGTLFGQRIVRVPDFMDAIAALQKHGRRVFAAALDHQAMQLGSFSLHVGDCVVIGNEGHGLSDATVKACDASVFIPMTDRAESLNAAVAAAILMWEFHNAR